MTFEKWKLRNYLASKPHVYLLPHNFIDLSVEDCFFGQQLVTKKMQREHEDGATRINLYAKVPPRCFALALDYGWSRSSSHRNTQCRGIVCGGGQDEEKHDGGGVVINCALLLAVCVPRSSANKFPRDRLTSWREKLVVVFLGEFRNRSCKESRKALVQPLSWPAPSQPDAILLGWCLRHARVAAVHLLLAYQTDASCSQLLFQVHSNAGCLRRCAETPHNATSKRSFDRDLDRK